jgi:hypothetical protein
VYPHPPPQPFPPPNPKPGPAPEPNHLLLGAEDEPTFKLPTSLPHLFATVTAKIQYTFEEAQEWFSESGHPLPAYIRTDLNNQSYEAMELAEIYCLPGVTTVYMYLEGIGYSDCFNTIPIDPLRGLSPFYVAGEGDDKTLDELIATMNGNPPIVRMADGSYETLELEQCSALYDLPYPVSLYNSKTRLTH